jgi:hypothetical protein
MICDNCGFETENIWIVESGETGLCSHCAFLDEREVKK